jgi:hypothetical protein
MSLSNRPFVLIAALIASGLCLFVVLQLVALILPLVLSGPYKWILLPLSILLIAVGGFLRARKGRKASLQPR